MEAFKLQDIDDIREGQAIVGYVKRVGLAGFKIPAPIKGNNNIYRKYMEIFLRLFYKVAKGRVWRGYLVDIDLETDGPVKLVLEEVAPRAYLGIRWEDALERPDKTYYTFM